MCPLSAVIVSRFTSFTENFVICCYQVTKVFFSKYCITSAFPAQNPSNLGSKAHLANEQRYCAASIPLFVGRSESESREVLADVSRDAIIPSHCCRFFCEVLQPLAVLRRRIVAGLDEESSAESCVDDVGDALAVELEGPVDKPGPTMGT